MKGGMEQQAQFGIDCLCPPTQQYTTERPCLVLTGTGLSRSIYFSLMHLLSDAIWIEEDDINAWVEGYHKSGGMCVRFVITMP